MSQDCQVVTIGRNIYKTYPLVIYLRDIIHRLYVTFNLRKHTDKLPKKWFAWHRHQRSLLYIHYQFCAALISMGLLNHKFKCEWI